MMDRILGQGRDQILFRLKRRETNGRNDRLWQRDAFGGGSEIGRGRKRGRYDRRETEENGERHEIESK